MPTEIRTRRTLCSKTSIVSTNDVTDELVTEAHCGPIHYDNKLALGDGVTGLRGLDFTLTEKDGGGWTFLYNSFHPDIPQYADGWLGFRDLYGTKDQTVRFKAPSHTEGRLISQSSLASEGLAGLTDWNAVIYDDAFGEGIDYIVYFSRTSMKKVARIRSAYKGESEVTMEWEFEIPEGCEIWRVDGVNDYELDTTRPKDFDTAKRTELRTADGTTFFRPFKVWDSGTLGNCDYHEQVCVVSYRVEDGKTYLKKHIPASFLAASVGDVFCDTVTSYYTGTADGGTGGDDVTTPWSSVRGSSGGYSATGSAFHGCYYVSGVTTYRCYRDHFPFDLSAMTAGSTITAGTLNLYTDNNANWVTYSGRNTSVVVQSTQPSMTTIANSDYSALTLNSPTEGSSGFVPSNRSGSGGWLAGITLNSSALGWAVPGSYLKLAIRHKYYDVDDHAPTQNSGSAGDGDGGYCAFNTVEGANDPYVSLTWTAPATPAASPRRLFAKGGGVIGGIAY